MGGKITKRVFAPSPNTDYSSYVQQLPPPTRWTAILGDRRMGTGPSLKAFTQQYGPVDPKKMIGNLFFAFLGADKELGPQLVGAYMGGFGTGPGLQTKAAKAYRKLATSGTHSSVRTTASTTTGASPLGADDRDGEDQR